ncbi:MAG: acetyl-CoA carboxylase biotin carboxylase subunit, partial [Pseudomonadota bacterium]
MFKRILIANRGEIARRIIRTANNLGIETVAVYSEADQHAIYVSEASQAICIGPPPAVDSYLNIEKVIDAAKSTGAEAIHPGYGFLSENADFADACAGAGIVFIGPNADVIRKMGSKESAKSIMAANDVPVVPGADDGDLETLKQAAESIGLPVLIKAVAGGGGRGMRLVSNLDDFEQALTSARREAASAFGNDKVLLEKYIEQPRHLEVQIFGDTHGNVIHAFERDCSTQRRYQKVIEEAPAANITEAQRNQLHQAAVKAGQAVNYVGAGTVEFVMDKAGAIYFIEMNTRLQVEHPVTEMITGEDLVHWQFIAASGGALPGQSTIKRHGHAIELRLCAEDPANDFAPSIGEISYLGLPTANASVRIDSGVAVGSHITPFYDSMFAKLIVHGDDRSDAINRVDGALRELKLGGLHSNRNFLHNILQHPRFQACDFDTHFVDDAQAELVSEPSMQNHEKALAGLAVFEHENRLRSDTTGPWEEIIGFRSNLPYARDVTLTHEAETFTVKVSMNTSTAGTREITVNEEIFSLSIKQISENQLNVDLKQTNARVGFHLNSAHCYLYTSERTLVMQRAADFEVSDGEGSSGKLVAPMPGAILDVFVKVGDEVTAGASLMLMEAMKIEHAIVA